MLPVGTVMVKSFLFDGKLVETRLFVHFDAADWVGYSYQWNEAQTEATIVADERVEIAFNTGQRTVTWHLPSRMDCTTCHTTTGGSTLGPETAQMNRVVGGHESDRSPRRRLGLFETAPPTPYKAALADPHDERQGTIEERARSYLHANCAFCHRPDDPNFASIDLRRDVAFKDTKTCGVAPERGNQGVPTSLIVTRVNRRSPSSCCACRRRPTTRTASTDACRRSRATSSTRWRCRCSTAGSRR